MLTALQLAEGLGAKSDSDGMFSGGELLRFDIPILGGCQDCHATLACYNAYPSRTGFWLCRQDIEGTDLGFDTVEAFTAFEQRA